MEQPIRFSEEHGSGGVSDHSHPPPPHGIIHDPHDPLSSGGQQQYHFTPDNNNRSIQIGGLHLESSLDDHSPGQQKDRSGSTSGSGLDEDFDFLHNHEDEQDRKIITSNARRFIDTSADVPIEGFSPVEEEEPSTLSPSQKAFVEDLVQLATKESQIILNEQHKLDQQQQQQQKQQQENKEQQQQHEKEQQQLIYQHPAMTSKLVTFEDEEPHRHEHHKMEDEEPIEQSTYSRRGPLIVGAGHAQPQQEKLESFYRDNAEKLASINAASVLEQQLQQQQHEQQQSHHQQQSFAAPEQKPAAATAAVSPKGEIITPSQQQHENVFAPTIVPQPQPLPRGAPKETQQAAASIIDTTTDFQKGNVVKPEQPTALQTGHESSCCLISGKQVCDLVHWRDAKKSAIVFLPVFLLLLAASLLPFLTLVCYAALIFILSSITLRAYSLVMHYFVKEEQPSVVEKYLRGGNWQLNESNLAHIVQPLLNKWNLHSNRVQEILLAKNMKEALVVALVLWIVAYFTLCISLPCFLLLGFVGFFTLPKFYEVYKQPIDKNVAVGQQKFNELYGQVQNKVANVVSKVKKTEVKKD